MPTGKPKAAFIEPMLLLRTEKLPEGEDWQYELKFDGYRALAIKSGAKIQLRSRNDNDFNSRYPEIVKALTGMPDDTVIDGEVVALDEEGRPSFNTLQNYGSAGVPLHFFIFDLMILGGRDVMGEPLTKRRELIEQHDCRNSPIRSGCGSRKSHQLQMRCRNPLPKILRRFTLFLRMHFGRTRICFGAFVGTPRLLPRLVFQAARRSYR